MGETERIHGMPDSDGDGGGRIGTSDPTSYRAHVERLVRRLSEAEGALQALAAGQVDAVVDPATAAPILLSQAQEALARSEARYRDLVSSAPCVVCELGPDGDARFVNEAVRSILGFAPESLVGGSWWDALVPAEHRGAVTELLQRLQREDLANHELPMRTASGELRWISWSSSTRENDGDGSVVLFGMDVTARHEADRAARKLAAAQIAQARAEAANRAKTDFLAVMSHELRTPLNAIGGYAQLIELGLHGEVTEAQLEDLSKIRRAQRHLLGLINDIMNFARLEAGVVAFQLERVSMRDVMETIRSVTEPQMLSKGLRYEFCEVAEEVRVWADKEKVQQILVNLVSNSIKFTGAGGQVTVWCGLDPQHVVVRVTDTGRGIPADKLATIFEPFVQVNRNLRQPEEGVGLGLAISRDLARAMHGDLDVESQVGVGSVFTLTLPRRAGEG